MFWKRKPFLVLTFLLIAGMLLGACGKKASNEGQQAAEGNGQGTAATEQGEFLIGVIPAQGSNQMKTGADKLAAILSEKLGRKVRAEVYPDYNGVVEAMGAGKAHMAYLGPLTYVEAHERYNVKAVVTQLINGKPFYYAYMIAPSDSPYATLDDVIKDSKNVRFAFGDISSTSGSLIPGIALKKAGVFETQQKHQFKSVTYTGDHLATALAVQNKTQDVGAIDSAYFNRLVKDGKVDGTKIKQIWQSEELFQYPWAVIESTPEKDVKIIQDAMVAITDKDILDAFGGASGFTVAKNEDYAAIRQAAIADGRVKPKQ
ncbi:phosphate/phosphite/phosphonate ABC transporter substrate-binding protein [Paenibacillus mucilaginosus]|uniref:Phosphate-binding protein of phosphonate ABC transporter n=3 Tax=Paenibacillus mucilaginosus TaxID=61624 RepID=H6NJN6_9BACL|nr:phosphate/phosphite/phosphonate ABC transporter substrate-binding protein [Paenibacillus mucilaginosus]AEI41154.1 phosphate-binding protein of phosphonate ABC transporter [Paenibacillus mucilaginosus KNP414]AFC29716.1 phosphate-binding protein of phosphonate ABC transporter [Paenibacillus mucilaginosus 3016]AFH61900.1 phosphonate ABC transporter substrate-binding protein [Paenibacillus mucilaginosus K02]MCG7211416.1 phosphate/phosphite/phosphonate ABC transporter substrate-binding protein [P